MEERVMLQSSSAPVKPNVNGHNVHNPSEKRDQDYDEYRRALCDLTFNSKPIINSLTFLAQESRPAASSIVRAVDDHLRSVRRSSFF